MEINTNRNNIELKDILEYMGEEIIPHGRTSFKLRKHDSLIIKVSKFYWNSKNMGGNYFLLLKELYGFDNKKIWDTSQAFLDAVEYGDYIPNIKIHNKEQKEYKIYERKNSLNEIKDYLCEKRCIDPKIVESLYHNKLLYMDYKKNIIFVINDLKGNKIGEEIIGTGEIKYRRNTSNSKGFNLTRRNEIENKNINNLYIFEGTIDMLSYIQLFQKEINEKWKEENIRFLTLSGLREDILNSYLDNIKNIYVCIDNDTAGENFYNTLKDKLPNLNLIREKSKEKDWNEDLVKKELEKRGVNIGKDEIFKNTDGEFRVISNSVSSLLKNDNVDIVLDELNIEDKWNNKNKQNNEIER
ncbi:DUF3991 and toprim domain-containing protein [Streptobacillus felis]|uniref:DUF3991 and toprim domain-containing protein n=1 Tax=Streptobacillus felis TaxID=1384509 RepID=UPI00082B1F7F|nr:DUF3991 and toprim domain-containing protein [Streptobacillus felis]